MWHAFAVEVPPPEEEDDKEEEGEEEEKEDDGAQPGELAITGKGSDSDGSGTAPPSRNVWGWRIPPRIDRRHPRTFD